jgi:hypothetical protein
MVVIITNKEDICADFVVHELRQAGVAFWRFNTEDAPNLLFSLNMKGAWTATLQDGRDIDLENDLTGVWYRRPGWVGEETLQGSVGEFVNDQWRQLIWGLSVIHPHIWVNSPYANQQAECKQTQLRLANSVGLAIPDTVFTNCQEQLHNFRNKHSKGVVVKAIYSPLIEDENSFIFTHLLTENDVPLSDEMRLSPLICQEALLPKIDIRATIVGEHVYAATLTAAPADQVDWRMLAHEGNWEPLKLPNEISQALIRLCQKMRLKFAGIDLILHSGTYYFIEVNPNGEWGWLQTQAKLPIAAAIAKLLAARSV